MSPAQAASALFFGLAAVLVGARFHPVLLADEPSLAELLQPYRSLQPSEIAPMASPATERAARLQPGRYEGELPSASIADPRLSLTLQDDGTFIAVIVRGHDEERLSGTWNAAGNQGLADFRHPGQLSGLFNSLYTFTVRGTELTLVTNPRQAPIRLSRVKPVAT